MFNQAISGNPTTSNNAPSALNNAPAERMFDLAEKLKKLKDDKLAAEERVKSINIMMEVYENELSDLMADTETPNFTHSGMLYYLSHKLRASPVVESKAELYDALKENGYGDLVYETVNLNTLSSFVKEQIEQNADTLPDWLNGLVKTHDDVYVGIRKASRKK